MPDPDPVVPDQDGDPAEALARVLPDVPLWVFHGDDDPVFPVDDARRVCSALSEAKGRVTYTELAGFGHDVWDIAYYSPQVASWMFDQRRGQRSMSAEQMNAFLRRCIGCSFAGATASLRCQ